MAWFEREFIAVPQDRTNQLIYKWPDLSIRRFSRVIVNADQLALFVKSGHVMATMGPGRHRIDADELPVLGSLVDALTGGNSYRAELYFVTTRELPGIRFGGRLTDIVDPTSEQIVTLRVFGEFALSVRDPSVLITTLAGTSDLTDPSRVEVWSGELLLLAMKVAVTQGVMRGDWPVLGISAHLPEIAATVSRQTNLTLHEYGLRIARIGNFDITLAPDDADRLKRLAKDVTYVHLAGGFERYAAGELALGASRGLSDGIRGGDGGILGTALGLNAIQAYSGHGREIQEPATGAHCVACRGANPPNTRFCGHCGQSLSAPTARTCTACRNSVSPAARFCGVCGSPSPPSALGEVGPT